MKTTILFETDFNHSNSSKVLIGVFTNRKKLLSEVKKIIKKDISQNNGYDFTTQEIKEATDWNLEFFINHNQTQGLASFELVAEDCETNIIF